MFFWFITTSVWSVWFVFRDPKFDYRLLAIASLMPDLFIIVFGQARFSHSVVINVAVLFIVMLTTINRRSIRQSLLAIPIGMLVHLIFDGAFMDTKTFWWPLGGVSSDDQIIGVTSRGSLNIALELIGIIGFALAWRYFHLSDRQRRMTFVKSGSLQQVI